MSDNEDKKVKVENPKGTITLNEALIILKNKSDLGKMGLRIAAVRDGFKSTYVGHGKENFLIDIVKFQKWLKIMFDVPDSYKQISVIAKELKITTAYAYNLVKKHKIKTKKVGFGRGKIYVDFIIFKNTLNKLKRRNKED